MSYTAQAIGPADMATGFALAGVPSEQVDSPAEGVALVAALLGREDVGVVLVDESIMKAIPDDLRRRINRRPLPVLLPVPRPHWEKGGEDVASYLLDLLQRAIGYRMRLR